MELHSVSPEPTLPSEHHQWADAVRLLQDLEITWTASHKVRDVWSIEKVSSLILLPSLAAR